MDIGVWMSPGVLEAKLEQADTAKPEAAWNLARWPSGMQEGDAHRLFVACGGQWIGYFKLSGEALYLPEDERTPYVILFDTRSWTEIRPEPVTRFRGFTYKVTSDGQSSLAGTPQAEEPAAQEPPASGAPPAAAKKPKKLPRK